MPPAASGMISGFFGDLKFFSKFAPETAKKFAGAWSLVHELKRLQP